MPHRVNDCHAVAAWGGDGAGGRSPGLVAYAGRFVASVSGRTRLIHSLLLSEITTLTFVPMSLSVCVSGFAPNAWNARLSFHSARTSSLISVWRGSLRPSTSKVQTQNRRPLLYWLSVLDRTSLSVPV